MRIKTLASLTLSLFLCVSQMVNAEEHAPMELAADRPLLPLSPGLQDLLRQEMISIQNTMMQMMPSISSGDWDKVSEFAGKIADTHILKQKLTQDQFMELARVLPNEFKELDNEFHMMAGMMAHVAQERHLELVTFYYYKLTEGCVGCHSKFATHRFPALIQSSKGHSHQPPEEEHKHNPEHNH